MAHRIMLLPVCFGVGFTSVAQGLIHACQEKGINVGYFKPISQPSRNLLTNKKNVKKAISNTISTGSSISLSYVEQQMGDGKHDIVLEQIVGDLMILKKIIKSLLLKVLSQRLAALCR
jgi:phosphate acetyltransferase